MSVDPLTAAFNLGQSVIERIWPDANKRAEEIRKLEELRQHGDLEKLQLHVQVILGQLEVNKAEAQSKSLFVAGWRPAIGWVCTTILALAFIPKAIVLTVVWTWQCVLILKVVASSAHVITEVANIVLPAFPDFGMADIFGLLGSMLGIGLMRSWDKKNGTSTENIKGGLKS